MHQQHLQIKLFLPLLIATLFLPENKAIGDNTQQENVSTTIDAETSVICDEAANKCTALGKARAKRDTFTIYGDILTVFFTPGKKREISTMVAKGNVRMTTPSETAYGDHAHYDASLDRVILTGKSLKLETEKHILTAQDSIEYWRSENKGIAKGKAIIKIPKKDHLIKADTLIAYFKPSDAKTKNQKDKLTLDYIDAKGNLFISSPTEIITGNHGTYHASSEIAEIFQNVKITHGSNQIEGKYAKTNLKTNVSEMYAQIPGQKLTKKPKRIHGLIIPKDAKRTKKNSK